MSSKTPIRGESWKYSMGQKNGLHAFGYNSAKSEPIWMKSRTIRAKCWGAGRGKFWVQSAQQRQFERELNFFSCHANNARFHWFPVGQILQHLNPTTSIGVTISFQNRILTILPYGVVFAQNAKIAKEISSLATSGRHNSAMITNAKNSRTNGPPSFYFYH